jgi:superfamily I DNA/RNA helicase
MRCKHALKVKVKTLPGWDRRPASLYHCVAFPDTEIRGRIILPPEAPAEIVIDSSDLDSLALRLDAVFSYWRGAEPPVEENTSTLIPRLEEVLAPNVMLTSPLSVQMRDDEKEITRLTIDQFRLLDFLNRHRRAAISGCAGSGKTWMAAEKARRLGAEGFRTLLTCFNRPLGDMLASRLSNLPNVTVEPFHKLCQKMAKEANVPIPSGEDRKTFEEEYPEALSRSMRERPDLRFDAVIVDEGQDFMGTWWLALDDCFAQPRESIFYVFYDDNQKLYSRGEPIPPELPPFRLTENVRNTRSIFRVLTQFYHGDQPVQSHGPTGRSIETVAYSDNRTLSKELGKVIRQFCVSEHVSPEQLVVLSPKGMERSALLSLTLEGGYSLSENPAGPREVRCSSVHRFKGLESDIVILTELDADLPTSAEQFDAICYVAFSRPRHHLVVMGFSAVLDAIFAIA